jgi:hypothetical protein
MNARILVWTDGRSNVICMLVLYTQIWHRICPTLATAVHQHLAVQRYRSDSRALITPNLSAFHSKVPPASLILLPNSSPSPTPPRLGDGISPFGPKNRANCLETAGSIDGVASTFVGAISPLKTRANSSSPPIMCAPAADAASEEGELDSANTRITSGARRASRGRETRPRRGRDDLEWCVVRVRE